MNPPDTQDLPVNSRPPQPGPNAVQPPLYTPKQPSPQQADQAHHSLIGRAVSALMGSTVNYQVDPQTGKTIAVPQKQTPGQFGRSMVLGAMLGLAAGSGQKAEGGSVGGFFSGFGRGGAAVAEHGEQQDQQRYQRAQQQFKTQQEAQANQRDEIRFQREGEAFKTEQTHKQALIAAENAQTLRTQQLIKGETWAQYTREADWGKAKVQPYIESGIMPLKQDATQQDIQNTIQANPKASAWDWEQTGVKAVAVTNAKGEKNTSYVPTFSAFDPDKSIKVTPGFIKLLKDSKIDDYYPGTTDRLKEGQELKPAEFVAIKNQYQQVHNQQLELQKGNLSLEEMKERENLIKAEIEKQKAEAAKQGRNEKQAALLNDALDSWTNKLTDLQKANPNATHQDAFNALTPKAQFQITANLVKTIDSLEKQIKDALNQFPPDQATANDLKEQQEAYRQMQRMTIGAGAPLQGAPKAGTSIPDDVYAQYLKAYNGDATRAAQAAQQKGWGPPASTQTPPAPPAPKASKDLGGGSIASPTAMSGSLM